MSHAVDTQQDIKTLSTEQAKGLTQKAILIALLGIGISAAAAFTDSKRFAFSYLTAFVWLITIGLGALFFILIQHLTRAGWSVAARRHMEWVSGILLFVVLLGLPVAFKAHDIYHEWMGEHAKHDELLHKKAAYLNPQFFYIRAAIFVGVWALLSWWFRKTSKAQDSSGNKSLTLSMQKWSAPSILLFALSLTFAAFDWIMSLNPHWYSTIFGVYVFAGSVTSSLSVLALITIFIQKRGWLTRVSTVEHQHDIGKLLFGFVVFWTYIGFSQFFLIWYANIPEETIFFKARWHGVWKEISLLLFFGHFVIPFIALLSRTAKRSKTILGAVALWMLFMHWIDMYWLVMPTFSHGSHTSHFHFSWVDLAALAGPAGCLIGWIGLQMAKGPLYPLADPRLSETVRVENL